MTEQIVLLIVVAVTAALIPLAPKLLQLRISILRKIHLIRLANWHERHSKALVLAMRLIWVAIILLLLWIALSGGEIAAAR
jgi:hypothetical protein